MLKIGWKNLNTTSCPAPNVSAELKNCSNSRVCFSGSNISMDYIFRDVCFENLNSDLIIELNYSDYTYSPLRAEKLFEEKLRDTGEFIAVKYSVCINNNLSTYAYA